MKHLKLHSYHGRERQLDFQLQEVERGYEFHQFLRREKRGGEERRGEERRGEERENGRKMERGDACESARKQSGSMDEAGAGREVG